MYRVKSLTNKYTYNYLKFAWSARKALFGILIILQLSGQCSTLRQENQINHTIFGGEENYVHKYLLKVVGGLEGAIAMMINPCCSRGQVIGQFFCVVSFSPSCDMQFI